jgi:hypothetical protein
LLQTGVTCLEDIEQMRVVVAAEDHSGGGDHGGRGEGGD